MPKQNNTKISEANEEVFLSNGEVRNAVLALYDKNNTWFANTDQVKAKVYKNEDTPVFYLLAETANRLTVYEQPYYRKNEKPFQYELEQLKTTGEIYATELLILNKADGTVEVESKSPYQLKHFFSFLNKEQCLEKVVPDEFWISNGNPFIKKLQPKISEMVLQLNALTQACEENKFTQKNKYEFNDLDNYVWKEKNGLCFSGQNEGFYVEQNNDNYTIYACDKGWYNRKKNQDFKELFADLKQGTTSLISDVVLKIESGKATFVDPSLIEALQMDLSFSHESLVRDNLIEQKFPDEMKLLTPREYVLKAVADYPTLYAAPSYEEAAYKVFDQLFNVIGNGVSDQHELMNAVMGIPVDEEKALKYLKGEEIFYGYTKVKTLGSGTVIPDRDSFGKDIVALASEKEQHPDVKLWIGYGKKKKEVNVPYPNFSKEYSLFYQADLSVLGEEWKQAVHDYYNQSKQFFLTTPEHYHNAYPSNNHHRDEQLIKDFTEAFKKYSSNEEISKAYESEYNGDVVEFVTNKWKNELAEILSFIDETIDRIENMGTTQTKKKKASI